ncbi:MurR/RpiR family transcriptional regulator [Paradonghicola geojensis]|nr:MurR/RpiR family transcriptional regulator [Marivivens geojensis]
MEPVRTTVVEHNLLEVIARSLPVLRKSDRRVGEAILAAPEAAVEMTLASLASAAEVSEPTVIRFAAAIGCDGFRDLRVKLARSLAFSRTTSHSAIAPTDELDGIIGKVFDFNLSNIAWVSAHLDPTAIAAAVEALSRAPRIEFFGLGASGIVALDAQQKFPLFGVPCIAQTDGHQMLMAAAMLRKGDVAVAISNTASTLEVVRAARVARERGATTIGITGSHGPLLQHCYVSIVSETLENTDLFTPTASRISAMIVIDILSTAVSLRRSRAEQNSIAEMKRLLSDVRSGRKAEGK